METTSKNLRIYTFSFVYTSSFILCTSSFILCTSSFILVQDVIFHPLCFILHPCTRIISSSYKDDNLKVHLVTQNIIPRDTSPDYHFSAPQTFPPSMGSSCDPASVPKRSSINCAPMVLHSCKNLSNSDLGNL